MKLLTRAVLAHRGGRYRRRVDPDEIRWMRSVLRPGDVAVDVGAYKGGYTYWMRREVGVGGTVVAFEPQPTMAAYLRRCVADFGWRNVHVDELGLSSAAGTGTLFVPADDHSPGASLVGASVPDDARRHEVQVDTLDSVLARRAVTGPLRLIKCDVEGHELDVFRGAARTLETHKPHLLFECETRHLRGRSMEDVFGHLQRLGYRGSFFWMGERLGVGDFDPARHQVEGRKPYMNNFVFAHPDNPGGS